MPKSRRVSERSNIAFGPYSRHRTHEDISTDAEIDASSIKSFGSQKAVDTLCDVCSTVGLPNSGEAALIHGRLWEPGNATDSGLTTRRVGYLPDFRSKPWCAFCRLLVAVVLDTPPLKPNLEQKGVYLMRMGHGYLAELGIGERPYPFILFCAERLRSNITTRHTLRLIRGREVDFQLIRKWVDTCESQHDGQCSGKHRTTERPTLIRVVDVVDHRILEVSTDTRYLTLSYVWGDVPTLRLTRENLEELSQINSLDSYERLIPRTIKDALNFVVRLEERFIWIDTLCLVSDDPSDMERGIASMDAIYEGSYLNIIAASGFDANSGLPGVRYGSRRALQDVETVRPGVRLGVHRDLSLYLSASKYSSRGWT